MVIDTLGFIYISGNFVDQVIFDNGSIIYSQSTSGNQGIYVLKIDTTGSYVWIRGISKPKSDFYISGFQIDNTGNLYVGYYTQKNYTIAKVNSKGEVAWTKSVINQKAANILKINDFKVDNFCNIYILGAEDYHDSSKRFLYKLDSTANIIWNKDFIATGSIELCTIVADNAGNTYLNGGFAGIVNIDSTLNLEASSSTQSTIILKLDRNGNPIFLQGKEMTFFSLLSKHPSLLMLQIQSTLLEIFQVQLTLIPATGQ